MTRFADWSAWPARLLLAVLGAVVLLVAMSPPHSTPLAAGNGHADVDLYREITDDVGGGQDYYRAALAGHLAHNYPVRPAYVFREPALAMVLAPLGSDSVRRAALLSLVAVTCLAMRAALDHTAIPSGLRLPATLLFAAGTAFAWFHQAVYLHEAWSGLLIALSLALWQPTRWWPAVIVALAACMVRELAFPYLCAMAAAALWDRRWPELLGWTVSAIVFLLTLSAHWAMADQLGRGAGVDAISSIGFGGLGFVILAAKRSLLLLFAPGPIVILALGLAVIGLFAHRDSLLNRGGLIVAGYAASFLIVGRPDNAYWGLLWVALIPLGLVAAPMALRDIVSAAAPAGAPEVGRR